MNKGDAVHFVSFLLRATPVQNRHILNTLSKTQLQYIVEIVFNVLQGVVPLSKTDKTLLKRWRSPIRALTAHKATLRQRKQGLKRIRNILPVLFKAYLKYVS